MDAWDSDDWLEREGAARRTQLIDPVDQVEDSYRRLASAGLQVAQLYHEVPGTGPQEARDQRLREYAREYLPGVREAEAGTESRGDGRVDGWLRTGRGEVVVDEGEDDIEEGQLMDAYAHGDVRQVARLLTRKRQRMVRDYPGLMAARRAAGEPLEGRPDEEVAAADRIRLGAGGLGLYDRGASYDSEVDSDDSDVGHGSGGSGHNPEEFDLLDSD